MGYIVVDEEKLKDRIALWNNSNYSDKVLTDVYGSRADYSHMLEALRQEEMRIEEEIKKLELKKGDIAMLMKYAKL